MSSKSAIVRQFAKPSGAIGALAGHIMARRPSNRIRNQRTVELMGLQPDSRVLEIGCGPGLALANCAAKVTHGRVVGIDHSSIMIAQARQRLARTDQGARVELVVGGIKSLSGWPEEFDRTYSLNVIQFIADKAGFFRRVIAALDNGGMCFTTYQPRLDNDASNGAAQMADEVEKEMIGVGFCKIGRADINAGPTQAICVFGTKEAN